MRAPPEVRDRLLHAWRGEIVAGAVYELIARRMPDREAAILRRMAAAEGAHRGRLEQRMRALGIEIPDPASVRLSPWLRLQARIAPIDRLLAAREAAEDDEVSDLYKRSTGDPETDALLREIRKEERSHSKAVQEIRSNGDEGSGGSEPPAASFAPPAVQERLDKVLGREKWHRTGGGWISGAIYGANDGLAAVFGIVAGVSGATGGSSFVLTAGAAGAIASALSMATGAFLAERSEAEVMAANVERERQEIAEHPEEEKEELSLFYQLKGVDETTADQIAEQLSKRPDAMLRALAQEELGGIEHRSRRDRAGDPVHVHHWDHGDRDRGRDLADRAFPRRRRQVAGDPEDVVVGGPRDDARRPDRRRRYVPCRSGAADIGPSASPRNAVSSERSAATSASSAATRSISVGPS